MQNYAREIKYDNNPELNSENVVTHSQLPIAVQRYFNQNPKETVYSKVFGYNIESIGSGQVTHTYTKL